MTYQIVYSSAATLPMQADDLEELLVQARADNATKGITGALVYTEGTFLQIIEGDRDALEQLMTRIRKDVRHEAVTILREEELPSPMFGSWGMAYVSATPEQAAQWAGLTSSGTPPETPEAIAENLQKTARFAQDILALAKTAPAQAASG